MSADKIVINVWLSQYPFPVFLETVRKRAQEFEAAHPEYRINLRTSWWQSLPEEVSDAALLGNAPTIASYYTGATQHARDTLDQHGKPLYTSVEQAIGGRTHILGEPVVVDDLVDAARSYYTIGGELSSMPLTLSTMLLYTNTSLLDEVGIAEVPSTWSEVDAACQALAKLEDGPSHGIAWTVDGKLFQHALAQQGAIFAGGHNGRSERATTIDLTSDGMMAYVNWWAKLHKDGHFLYTGTMQDWQGTFDALAVRRVAFRYSSSFDAKYMVQAAKDNGFKVAVSAVPFNGDLPYAGSWIGGDSLWLADGLDESTRDGALAFMQFINNPRNAAEWHKVYGSAPLTKASVRLLDDEGWFAEHPYYRAATEQLDLMTAPTTQALVGAYAHIQRTWMEAIEDVLVNDADPLTRFTAATAQAQDLLDKYNEHTRNPDQTSPYCMHVDS